MKKRLTKAITAYVGEAPSDVKTHRDPKVEGVYAAQATMPDGEILGFLFNSDEADEAESDDEVLEECDFESWPPESGPVRLLA